MAKSTTKAADESLKALEHLNGPEPLERVYLFYGDDSYQIDKLISAVEKKRFQGKKPDSLSWENCWAGETDAQTAINSVRTISMFGGPKVVVFRNIDKLNASDLQKIADYAKNPARSHLVLTATSLDLRKKSWSELKECSRVYNCKSLNDYNTENYIKEAGRANKLQLTDEAVSILRTSIGPNRALLERALEKITLTVSADQQVTGAIIQENVIDTRERSVFELTKAVSNRDIPTALEALRVLLDQKQEATAINSMLARHARMMLHVRLGIDQRFSDDEIMKNAGINMYALKEYKSAISHYSTGELYQFEADVFEADRSLKSKPVPAIHVLSRLLMSLLKPNGR